MLRAPALLIAAAVAAASGVAYAGDERASPAADDADLFACAKPPPTFTVNLKPDVELKDLVTWAMGFSCKRFLYSSSLATRAAKVTMITPGAMSPTQAWGLFEVALHGMGLALIRKGSVYEILESPTARDEAVAIAQTFPDGGACCSAPSTPTSATSRPRSSWSSRRTAWSRRCPGCAPCSSPTTAITSRA
jgi:hypothetical protein